ncbi:hypothetical protein Acr_20g0006440 [Actinidia rufa]|uniref:Uncharacterized protein n=1 Tax=Actinidia rufa TaxID=165716 RepID=A0A7J0GDD9_9ERIC|nr:hypothetical protein Acr_20g0006440 [Actinidia rufa]
MDLNQAQLLVYNDDALDYFREAHVIPDNVRIERPIPNKDAKIVEGNENRILVNFVRTVLTVDMLMRRENLSFSASDLLNVYSVVRLRRDEASRDDGMYSFPRRNKCLLDRFNDKFSMRSNQCTEAIKKVNNCGRPKDVKTFLQYEPIYCYVISYRADKELDENAMLAQALKVADHVSTPSTSSASSSSSSFVMSNSEEEVEDGEEVNQGEVPAPIVVVAPTPTAIALVLVVSSDSKATDDLDFPPILPAISQKTPQPTDPPIAQSLNPVVMLPQDMADLAIDGSVEFGDLMVMQHVQKAMEKLVAKEEDCKANNNVVAKSKLEDDVVQEELHKALQDLAELQKMAACSVYKGLARPFERARYFCRAPSLDCSNIRAEVGGANVSNELRAEVSGE